MLQHESPDFLRRLVDDAQVKLGKQLDRLGVAHLLLAVIPDRQVVVPYTNLGPKQQATLFRVTAMKLNEQADAMEKRSLIIPPKTP